MQFSQDLAASGFCYSTSPSLFGTWVSEGQATLMGERWSDEIDGHDGTDYFGFMQNYFAGGPTDLSLTETSYAASIYWSYACEQMGTIQTPPVRGTDLIRTVWETAQLTNEQNPQLNWQQATDSIGLLDAIIAFKERGSVIDLFQDFAIACYTHELDRTSIIDNIPNASRYYFGEADQYIQQPGFFDYPYGLPRMARHCYCLASGGCTTESEVLVLGAELGDLDVAVQQVPCQPINLPAVLSPSAAFCASFDGGDFNAYEDCERGRVLPLSIDYHQIDVATVMQDPCGTVDIRARACADVGWALVGVGPVIDNNTLRRPAYFLRTGRGEVFSETVLPRPGLERLALIVIGLEEESLYEIRIDRAQPRLSLQHPTEADPAHAGLPNAPDPFLIRAVLSGTADQIPGTAACPDEEVIVRRPVSLQPDDIQVELLQGGQVVGEVFILTIDRVGAEHWINVYPPVVPSAGVYDMRVRAGRGCAANEETSVRSVVYGPEIVNHVIVLDRSGSMSAPDGASKLDAAKLAARIYVNAAGANDRLGVVTFNGGSASTVDCDLNSNVVHPLTVANNPQKAAALGAIDAITPAGRTPLGDGIWRALNILESFDTDIDRHAMLVLSDGLENEERYLFAAVSCTGGVVLDPVMPRLEQSAAIASTIAFGPEADQNALQQVALDAGGIFQFVDVSDGEGGGAGLPGASLSMPNRLALAFLESLAHARDLERIALLTTRVEGRETSLPIQVEKSERPLTQGLFFFHWDRANSIRRLDLLDPLGEIIDADRAAIYRTPNHAVFHLKDTELLPGEWNVRVSADVSAEIVGGLLAKDRVGLQMDLRVRQPRPPLITDVAPENVLLQGIPVTIRCALADIRGPVLGAIIEVTVERPDGSTTVGGVCETLRLRDDGTEDDGAPNDGIYGLVYTQTQLGSEGGADTDARRRGDPIGGKRGSYIVRGEARGVTNARVAFARPVELHFQIFDGLKDNDLDGLPTGWELHYGTDPDVNDRLLDPDGDQINNIGELANGTDPMDPDTDQDGELDGTEVRNGRCPTVPGDQALPAPRDVEVVTDPGDAPAVELPAGGILLRFPWNGAYVRIRIERAPARQGP
ncbi:MAG TPA: VWA domain-containing protein, partial [Thermoanaerobaculia bacterium]|nr:VWA domain-containing protein [Thermoanaerobaculia bacterium]